jgi:hypothetical protein
MMPVSNWYFNGEYQILIFQIGINLQSHALQQDLLMVQK